MKSIQMYFKLVVALLSSYGDKRAHEFTSQFAPTCQLICCILYRLTYGSLTLKFVLFLDCVEADSVELTYPHINPESLKRACWLSKYM